MDQDNDKKEQQVPFIEVPLSTKNNKDNGHDIEFQNVYHQSEITDSAFSTRNSGLIRPLNYSDIRRSTLNMERLESKSQQNEQKNSTSP